MFVITGLSTVPTQKFQTSLADGTVAYFTLTYRPRIGFWYLDVKYLSREYNGFKLANVPNLLQQFDLNLPFGVFISVSDGGEPVLINDFISGRCQFCVLEAADLVLLDDAYQATAVI